MLICWKITMNLWSENFKRIPETGIQLEPILSIYIIGTVYFHLISRLNPLPVGANVWMFYRSSGEWHYCYLEINFCCCYWQILPAFQHRRVFSKVQRTFWQMNLLELLLIITSVHRCSDSYVYQLSLSPFCASKVLLRRCKSILKLDSKSKRES